MQLSGSRLVIRDRPIKQSQFVTLIPQRQLTQVQNSQKFDLQNLHTPIISVLFGYRAGVQFQGFQFQLELELTSKGEKISFKQILYKCAPNYLLRVIQIDSCLCYEKLMTLIVTIKYAQNEQCHEISSVKELCCLLSKREFVIYNQKTLTMYKRDIMIKQPINILYRYSPMGYIWIKCSNQNNTTVVIKKIELVNWLVTNNEELKLFESRSSLLSRMQIKKQQQVGVMVSAPKNLGKSQIPYVIEYDLVDLPNHPFKMIKYLYIS